MSKLKVLEINKQLKMSADVTLNKYNNLLKDAQESVSVVKKLEADLIKKAKAQAEENKIRKEQEKHQEAIKQKSEQVKVDNEAKVKAVAEPKSEPIAKVEMNKKEVEVKLADQTKKEVKTEMKQVEPKAEKKAEPKVEVKTKTEEKPKVEKVATPAKAEEKSTTSKPSAVESKPVSKTEQASGNKTQGTNPRYQGNNPRPQTGDNRSQGTSPRYQGNNPRPQGGYKGNNPRPQGGYQGNNPRPQGGYQGNNPRPQGGYQGNNPRPQGGYQGNNPRPQGGYQGNNPRPQGGYQGNNPRPQGGYQGNNPRPQGGYQGNNPRPQGGYQGNNPRPQGGYQGNNPRPQGGYKGNNPRPQGGYQGNRPQGGKDSDKPTYSAATNQQNRKKFTPGGNSGGFTKPNATKNSFGNNRYGGPRKNKRPFNRAGIDIYKDEVNMRGPRKVKKVKEQIVIETKVIESAIITTENVSVKVLAEKTGKPVAEILKKLLLIGMMCTINSEIDFDTAQLICTDFNIDLEQKLEKTAENVLDDEDKDDDDGDLVKRPPVVTIMGHVDHGKTSLLDAIRQTKVTEGEAGGITQHIGAYTVEHGEEPITFLDTPGHEAFTSMRMRGAQATDIAILVVAADDGVMPQTVEAINHAKAADVPIIVAINKIDKPAANIEKIKQELTEHELVAEEWGGDTIMVPVSAITKDGIDKLLEMILLVSEIQELTANPDRLAKGTIIEAKLDKGRGPVATVLVTNGTLRITDGIVAGTTQGRIRAMVNDDGVSITEAGPSTPVEVIGFSEVPAAGDILHAVEKDKLSRKVVEERKNKQKAERLKNMSKVSLDDLFDKIAEGQLKNLNIIVKADVQGSAEAIRQALEKIESDEVKINVKHAGVGAIAKADVMLASASNAIIIGFNVRPDNIARAAAEEEKVDLRLYRVIYDAIEDIEKAIIGMLDPEFEEEIMGHVEIRELFKVSNVGTIGGCYVTDGKVNRNAQLRLLRDNIVIHEGEVGTLRRFKDDVKEVAAGYECGVSINNYNNIQVGDIIEAFEMKKVER